MNITKAHNLACPIDGKKLEQRDKQYFCDNGHSFDIARQGYVNLLPVQHKRSKQPGDSKAMVIARTQFLDSGIYQDIAKKLSDIVASELTDNSEICLLDAGCGEGYYFDAVFNAVQEIKGNSNVSFIGLDISKEAIIQSTKRNKQISWVVGTNRQPPVENESIDVILCLFGFLSLEGFSKTLKPGGRIILVDPGADHLKELREVIYPEVKKAAQLNTDKYEMPGFSLLDSQSLQFKTVISSKEQISHLLVMTPHFYRASKAGQEAASKLDVMDITVDVVFRILQKDN